ncbi:MAG: bifunctional adenosylcobinamide kinase/adenosylcobinamide-phosphate guanylyltransferase [Selenomonas sp.]|uniref:bifunctional adenosylcobinamide kinase/adenosylcobinamide-phosphate guanylyltransferase n=3 Tax=Selenomonas sp. TaxID=2053611 RepID=UPI0026004E90|nr:bifunctional adenosylcobinamide kinase/adenosylcobinamide-phosphate guanylyltransferase [Selenomonas sp.]MCI6086022.1 bifunctional adenosylcobinamide kinase/adenosylcobinamide-phosphate guanylyltransferase [Selenomonas sp.]
MSHNHSHIILVTGGARSGKSAFAERFVAAHGQRIAYVATAQILDEEMRYRVALHKKRRPAAWTTYEAPFAAEGAIRQAAEAHDALLFDCLTVYFSNLLCSLTEDELADEARVYELAQGAADRLIAAAEESGMTCVFVTNEVGAGIVPENKLARLYRDIAGLVNQQVAAAAEVVYLTVSGIPVDIKKLASQISAPLSEGGGPRSGRGCGEGTP